MQHLQITQYGLDPNGEDTVKVFVPQAKWPNVYNTHLKGIAKNPHLLRGDGKVYLDYDPLRSRAIIIRREAKKGVINPSPHDIDEFPYASTKQGGIGAATNIVPRSENRQHRGYLGFLVLSNQMKEGDVWEINLIPNRQKDKQKVPVSEPVKQPIPLVPSRKPMPINLKDIKPIGGYPGQGTGEIISKLIEKVTGIKIDVPDLVPVPAKMPATRPSF